MTSVMYFIHIFLCLLITGRIHVVCGSSCVTRYSPESSGSCIEASQCTGAALPGLCTNDPGTVCCIPSQNNGDTVLVRNRYVARNTFYEIFGKTRRSSSLYPYYIKALDDAGISTPEQIAAFTAQIFDGTSNLTLTEEDSDGLKYEGSASLGNIQPGDGPRFRGRGIIPIRGRHMYKVLAVGISEDLEDVPETAAMPSIAFEIAVWLWKNGYESSSNTSSRNNLPLKDFACNSKYDFVMMSYAINQDNRTVAQRQFPTWLRLIRIMNASCPSEGQGSECRASGRQGVCELTNSGCKGRSVENLCEGPADIECCVACNNPVDIVFVVDSSGSVGLHNFKLMMNFTRDVSMRFYVASSKDGTQIALIRYSSTAEVIFDFKKHQGHNAVEQALSKVRYTRGRTNTILALNIALHNLFKNPSSGVRTKSSGVSRILILLTDGKTNDGLDAVKRSADALRLEGVDIFAVGIGEGVKESELRAIANDPPEDYMFLSRSFQALKKIAPAIEVASCNEPAFLEPGTPVKLEVKRKEKKFFRYKNSQMEELTLLITNQTSGMVDLYVSFTEKTPIKHTFTSCNSKDNFITDILHLEPFMNNSFCTLNPRGGIILPSSFMSSSGKSKESEVRVVALIKMCSRKNLYVGVKGLHSISSFDLSLLNFSTTNIGSDEEFKGVPSANSFDPSLMKFFNTNISNDIEFLSSEDKLDDFSAKNRTAPTFPIKFRVYIGCFVAGSGAMATILSYLALSFVGQSAELVTTNGFSSQMENTKSKNKKKKDNESEKSDSEEEKPQNAVIISTPHARFQGLIRHVLLLLTVINAWKRRPRNRYYDKENQRQPDKELGENENYRFRTAPDQTPEEVRKECSRAESNPMLDNGNLPFVGSTSLGGVSSVFSEMNIKTKTQSFLSGKSEKPSANGTAINEQENRTGSTAAGNIESVVRNSSKRQLAAMILPCFTLFTSNDHDGETEQKESEAREKRFENDMHVSQAFCVLAIQAIFMLLIKSRKNELGCTAAAISMNYVYLAAMVWLLIEACCVYRMARRKESKRSCPRKLFYVVAWGFPLVVVPIMMIKHTRYMANAHCWISMVNLLDLAASGPFFAVALIQLIVFWMLVITLCTYKNRSNDRDNKEKMKKDKLKTGLRNTFCISLLVLGSWVMSTLSVTIHNNLYQTAFAAVNCAQGGALLLFYVLLNKDTRQAALKLLGKRGFSKKSGNLNNLKFGQVLKGKRKGSHNVTLESISRGPLKNTLSKDPTQILSFGITSTSTKDNQQRATSNQADDHEQIISLKSQEYFDAPRRSNRNKMMVPEEVGKDDSGAGTSVREGVRRVHNAYISLTPSEIIGDQVPKSGLTKKLSEAKNVLQREGQASEMLSKSLRRGSRKLTKLVCEQF